MYRDLILYNRNDFFPLLQAQRAEVRAIHKLPKQRELSAISLISLKAHFQAPLKEFSDKTGNVSRLCSTAQGISGTH